MKSSCKKVNAQKGYEDGKKTDDHHVRCFSSPPPDRKSVMDKYGVDDPCDKRPCFLRVPAPV